MPKMGMQKRINDFEFFRITIKYFIFQLSYINEYIICNGVSMIYNILIQMISKYQFIAMVDFTEHIPLAMFSKFDCYNLIRLANDTSNDISKIHFSSISLSLYPLKWKCVECEQSEHWWRWYNLLIHGSF